MDISKYSYFIINNINRFVIPAFSWFKSLAVNIFLFRIILKHLQPVQNLAQLRPSLFLCFICFCLLASCFVEIISWKDVTNRQSN